MKYTTNSNGNIELSFSSNINIERSCTPDMESLGVHESTMELFTDDQGIPSLIEWVVGDGDVGVEHIGLRFEGKTLEEYDGVFEIPSQAIALIRKAGYMVPKHFED